MPLLQTINVNLADVGSADISDNSRDLLVTDGVMADGAGPSSDSVQQAQEDSATESETESDREALRAIQRKGGKAVSSPLKKGRGKAAAVDHGKDHVNVSPLY